MSMAGGAVASDQTPSAGGSSNQPLVVSREPSQDATPALPQKTSRFGRTTNWIIAVPIMMIALAVVYYAVKSPLYSRSQYPITPSSLQVSLSAAEESMRTEQRAWVGLHLPAAYPLTKEGGGFAIKLQNFGKTPARNVLIVDYVTIEDLDQLSGIQEAASQHPMAAGTLMPGDGFSTDVWFKTSPEGVTGLAQGKVRAVNYALITYEDIFQRRHTTQGCFYWHGRMHVPLPCERSNSVE